jgi:hypothetical protein
MVTLASTTLARRDDLLRSLTVTPSPAGVRRQTSILARTVVDPERRSGAWSGPAKSASGLATASERADTSSREQMCDI